jgi:hypothetical protein
MNQLEPPSADDITRHFRRALMDSERRETPYRHWRLVDVLPEDLAIGLIALPIAPMVVDDCRGVRDVDNSKRTFLTPWLRSRFEACDRFAEALQRPDVARLVAKTCEIDVEGAYLRMEYIQDIDGAWLVPHCDVPQKLMSMVIYLCTGPDAPEWGTDIYDAERRWAGRASAEFNSAAIFIPGKNTWHGFEKRKLIGIRRLFEINYVHPSWRDRDQLCYPDRPVTLGAGAS